MEEPGEDTNNKVNSSQETAPVNSVQESTDKVKVVPSSETSEKSEKQLLPKREQLISVAVNFLQNNKVQSSSYQLKRSFLLKKGLTESEIQTAFARAGVKPENTPPPPGATTPSHNDAPPGHYQTPSISHQMVPPGQYQMPSIGHQMVPYQVQTYQNSFSSKVRDFANFFVLIGGASYAINFLWKKYIRPWLYGAANPTPRAALVTTVQSLLQAVDTLKAGVTQLQQSMDKYTDKVDKLADKVDEVAVAGDNGGWRQTLLEVKSVKGLMLSSQQFPSHPPTQFPSHPPTQFPSHPPTPAIPAWQRLEPSQTNKIDPDIIVTRGMETDGNNEVEMKGGKRGSGKNSSGSEIELIGEDSLHRSSSSDEGGAFKQLET